MPRNVQSILITLGTTPQLAVMAVPFVWMAPGTTDPDSATSQIIIKAVQRGLDVPVSGVLDLPTANAIQAVEGAAWMRRPWIKILEDALEVRRNPSRHQARVARQVGLAGYFQYDGIAPGPLPGRMVGTPAGPWAMGDSASDAGVGLTFGLGVSNPKNIVPIPRSSGTTYGAFRNLQRQINRMLTVAGGGRISEDGIIGPGTFAAFKKVQDKVFAVYIPGDDNSLTLAEHAVTIANMFEREANSQGIAAGANKGSTSTAGGEHTTSPITPMQKASYGGGAMASLKKYGPFLLLAGGVAYYASTKRKKRRKK